MADAGVTVTPASRPPAAEVVILRAELDDHGAVFCPNPKMPLWSTHPRVFLDLARNGRAKCPYCSTVYTLQGGAVEGGH